MEVSEQVAAWNGPGGEAWVRLQPLMDDVLRPFERLLVDELRAAGVDGPVLDVGCGAGATTLALAREVGPATGVDVSAPLVALAERRAAEAGLDVPFVVADAQRHRFEAGGFAALASRFGVMFFDDPTAAFANLRSAVRPGGPLRVVAWRSPAENPFMTTAEAAAARHVELPPRDPEGPGQFGFADAERVERFLTGAGWRDVALEPVDVPCRMPATALEAYVTQLGPLARALAEVDETARREVVDAVLPAFDPFVRDGEVRIDAACWLIRARA